MTEELTIFVNFCLSKIMRVRETLNSSIFPVRKVPPSAKVSMSGLLSHEGGWIRGQRVDRRIAIMREACNVVERINRIDILKGVKERNRFLLANSVRCSRKIGKGLSRAYEISIEIKTEANHEAIINSRLRRWGTPYSSDLSSCHRIEYPASRNCLKQALK